MDTSIYWFIYSLLLVLLLFPVFSVNFRVQQTSDRTLRYVKNTKSQQSKELALASQSAPLSARHRANPVMKDNLYWPIITVIKCLLYPSNVILFQTCDINDR